MGTIYYPLIFPFLTFLFPVPTLFVVFSELFSDYIIGGVFPFQPITLGTFIG